MMDPESRERIRIARNDKGLSLRELARRLGVSASLLSQIENGRSDPSVSTLYALVSELGLSLDSLLGSPETRSPVSTPGSPARSGRTSPVVDPSERRVLHMDSGVVWERLTRGPSDVVDALLVTYEPRGASSSTGKLMTHSGLEFAYLLEGELTLQLGFETHVIRTGDSLEFDASTPHMYVNAGSVTAKGLWYVVGNETTPAHPSMLLPGSASAGTGTRLTSAVDVLHAFSEG